MELLNKFRRRLHQWGDQSQVVIDRVFSKKLSCEPYDGMPRVSLVTVSFNTLDHVKLMLLTLADTLGKQDLKRIVIVDNGSTDGSREFLARLGAPVAVVHNDGRSTHARGLRVGISYIERKEKEVAADQRTNVYLIVDPDIIFLREDWFEAMTNRILAEVAIVGELQYDVGEPYAHPSCLMLRRDCYQDSAIWPFVDHGAPALWLQQSLRKAGYAIFDFPVRSENYVLHVGRGSIAGIKRSVPTSPYATVCDDAHFHGNQRGDALLREARQRFQNLLAGGGEEGAVKYINAALGRQAERNFNATQR